MFRVEDLPLSVSQSWVGMLSIEIIVFKTKRKKCALIVYAKKIWFFSVNFANTIGSLTDLKQKIFAVNTIF